MVVKDFIRESHTFQPGPFGWCCYDCNEGEANSLASRSPRGSPAGRIMRLLSTAFAAILLIATLAGCSESMVPVSPTSSTSPTGPFTVQYVADTKEHHQARAQVQFDRGPVLIRDVVAEFHDTKNEMFLGAKRGARDYYVLRFHGTADAIAEVDVGQVVLVRCHKLQEGRSGWFVLSAKELVCLSGEILE